MSKLNIASNLMLGKAELNRFQNFIFDSGFVKSLLSNTVKFGIVYNTVDSTQTDYFLSFKVEQGTNQGTIKVNPGVGIDANGNFITLVNLIDNIAIPDDGNYYWIKIAWVYSNIEQGTVSIDSSGNLLGVGTEFTKLFRGQPNFPTRIKFPNSTLNLQEYDILSVTSDTVALLNVSTINAESNLQYEIVGTFTPGQVPPIADKFPFQYDSCIPFTTTNGIVEETTFNVRPNYQQNIEFYIARVKNNSGVLEIQDKRDEIWQPKADFELQQLLYTANACFGLEGVMYDTLMGTNSRNFAIIGWGVRSNNWTLNHSNRIVSLLNCIGGKYKSTADFTNNSFDYWRVYSSSGVMVKVLSSTKNGTQIDLYVDKLDPDDFPDGEIVVVPDAEEIELIFSTTRLNAGTGSPVVPGSYSIENNKTVTFPISDSYGTIPLAIWDYNNPDSNYMQSGYNVTFRYKSFKTYSPVFIDASSYNYYGENAYDSQGNLVNNTNVRTMVSGGSFTIFHSPQAYHFFKSAVYLGDKYCVYRFTPNNTTPIFNLQVGINCQYQIASGTDNMSVNQYVNLMSLGAVAGNKFVLNFQAVFNNPSLAYTFALVQDYTGSGVPQKVLYNFTQFDYQNSAIQNLMFNCEFDGTNWIVFKMISDTPTAVVTKNQVVYSAVVNLPGVHAQTVTTITHNQNLSNYTIVASLSYNPPLASTARPRAAYWFILNQDANSFTVLFQNAFNTQDSNFPIDFRYSLISLV